MLLKKEGNMTVQPTSSGVSRRCPIFSYTLGGFFSFLTFVLVSLPLAFFFAAAFFGAAFLAGACVLQKWGGSSVSVGMTRCKLDTQFSERGEENQHTFFFAGDFCEAQKKGSEKSRERAG